MRVLITGAGGQLGQALQETVPVDVKQLFAVGSAQLDISDERAVNTHIAEKRPNWIFNAAAYTAVDKAEDQAGRAYAINGDAVGYLARAADRIGARLIHVSTDFVFDGNAGRPYTPDSPTMPLNVYGASKLRGEAKAGQDALIVRTAWVYASSGQNFVHTMLRLMRERNELHVVADQVGTPTWATSLAEGLWQLAKVGAVGVFHYTDSGVASWYDFATTIQEEALAIGLLNRAIPILPIPTNAYPTPAQRPHYSVLNTEATGRILGKPAPHWRDNLRRMLKEVREGG